MRSYGPRLGHSWGAAEATVRRLDRHVSRHAHRRKIRIRVTAISHPGASDRANAIAAIAAMRREYALSFSHYIQSARRPSECRVVEATPHRCTFATLARRCGATRSRHAHACSGVRTSRAALSVAGARFATNARMSRGHWLEATVHPEGQSSIQPAAGGLLPFTDH